LNGKTVLFDEHVAAGARMVGFAGWDMPLHYGSQVEEHHAVRTGAGVFDVSHMTVIDIDGAAALAFLRRLLSGDVARLAEVGQALYTTLLNETGGILDDLIAYRMPQGYRLVVNAATRDKVLGWLQQHVAGKVSVAEREMAILAVQGPDAASLVDGMSAETPSSLRFFGSMEATVLGRSAFVGRTGYTGEDGFEIVADARDGAELWGALNEGGMAPCGLGARDVLRLEAGLPLHGSDIDLTTTPLEAGLGRFVRLGKEFAGSEALRRQKEEGVERSLVGIFSEGRSIPRHDYSILSEGKSVGRITSGSYSPTLDRNIAMGYVQTRLSEEGQSLQIDIRGRPTGAMVTSLPFYKRK